MHEAVLRANSRCFDASLSKIRAEGQEKELSLREESPETFNLYVRHLYSTGSPSHQPSALDESYEMLASLFALGARLEDQLHKERVLDTMASKAHAYVERNGGSSWSSTGFPSVRAVNNIYDATDEGSGGRRLMVDIYAAFSNPDWANFGGNGEEDEEPHPDFMLDLVKALLGRRAVTADKSQSLMRSTLSKYHRDTDGQV